MMKQIFSSGSLLILFLLLVSNCFSVEAGSSRKQGKPYKYSPKVTHHTKATLTLNSFQKGGDGGGPSECDNKYHSDNTLVVALSTRWFNNKKRCLKHITIHGNGRSVKAMVVDECDSNAGCANNIVDASKAVWKALGVPKSNWGELNIFWSDA